MEAVLNTPYYPAYNACGLLYADQNNQALAAQRALELYNLRSRDAPALETGKQQELRGNFPHHNRRERKTQGNRSRTLYNKRLLVNARERERMKTLNKGFENLRNALPCYIADGHISKITTLRLAINYIKTLGAVLQDAGSSEEETFIEPCTISEKKHLMKNSEPHNVLPLPADVNKAEQTNYSPQFTPIIQDANI